MVTCQFTCTRTWLQDFSLIKFTSLTCFPLLDISWRVRSELLPFTWYFVRSEEPHYRSHGSGTLHRLLRDYGSVSNCSSCYDQSNGLQQIAETQLRVTRVHEPLHNPRKMAIETMKVLLTAFHATSNLIDRTSSLSFWSYHYILMT